MEQKHFMEISYVKEQDTDLTSANTKGFEVGDQIVIQEKVDGASASFTYDKENDMLLAFSRRNELNYSNTLRGFWNWVQEELDLDTFGKYPDYIFFGEWLTSHKIQYRQDAYKKFYFYDVWDKKNQCYLKQKRVKELAEELGLIYVKTYYVGPFISWEHCKSFMKESDIAIGEPEGVVVKNQTKINNPWSRTPFVLKIVNEKFSERMKTKEKVIDPEKEAEKNRANLIVQEIITRNRIEKEIYKMIDEGILPEKIEPEDMRIVAKNLPKRIYQDCVKEELEMVKAAGEYFGKACGSFTMLHARNFILGRRDELESCTE